MLPKLWLQPKGFCFASPAAAPYQLLIILPLQGITPPGMTAKSPGRPKNHSKIAGRMGYAIL